MEDNTDDDFLDDAISDVSTDSIHESPSKKIHFSKPKTIRDLAVKIRQIERKIMLGLLLETEEEKLRKSKYFTVRFEKLLRLSYSLQKANLYKKVTGVYLNERMMIDLQKKADSSPNNLRRKHITKIQSLRNREKSVQEKISVGLVTQNEINSVLRDMYFVVVFGDNLLSLDHNDIYKTGATYDNDKGILLCDYCQSTVERNRFGQHEELLICKDCGNKAHPSCLSYSAELVEQIRSDGSWQCIDCKACIICEGTGDPDTLLFCDACDKGYHMNCHEPKLTQMPSGKWACANCQVKGKMKLSMSSTKPVYIIADDDEPPKTKGVKVAPTTLNLGKEHYSAPHTTITNIVQVHPPLFQNSQAESGVGYSKTGITHKQPVMQSTLGKGVHNNLTHILNPKVPLPDVRSSIREDVLKALPLDVADWTIDDVAYYFKSHGYMEEGALLQEQEIDGRALLLMSRNDCLTGMRIKLGPALKIYHMHIYKLQSRTDFLG
ncbi:uncharacterized protein LOC101241007 isoform X1 [Hydra vulgaris]|uniref:uncharacterized protein LOC101241007 isoform X1 n=1 Tax=Hydra vulgaris TaxID=6087 RepID=UPI0002B45242|nr:uncharacterized protein LOC101241007 isoform X1 [Hydra vulgaris]